MDKQIRWQADISEHILQELKQTIEILIDVREEIQYSMRRLHHLSKMDTACLPIVLEKCKRLLSKASEQMQELESLHSQLDMANNSFAMVESQIKNRLMNIAIPEGVVPSGSAISANDLFNEGLILSEVFPCPVWLLDTKVAYPHLSPVQIVIDQDSFLQPEALPISLSRYIV